MSGPMSIPQPVLGYVLVRIVAVCASAGGGGGGIGCPDRPSASNDSDFCSPGSNSIVMDRISCISCADSEDMPGLKPALVK
jgi:hypothetical protein